MMPTSSQDQPEQRCAYLVYNPHAGRYPSGLLAEQAANVLRRRNWEISVHSTRSGEHITQLAYQAVQEQMDAFFVVGGDGSIHMALPGLVGQRTALGIFPAGTANVWAQELGLPGLTWTRWRALEESAWRQSNARAVSVDIGFYNGQPFLLWAGMGLDGFIINRIEPRTRWKKNFAVANFVAMSLWNARQWHGMQIQVETDNQTLQGHFLIAVVSNIHLYAGGFAMLCPEARLDDGMMDLWLFEGDTLGDSLQAAWDLWCGKHISSARVIHQPFRSLRLSSDSPIYAQVDGEPYRSAGESFIEVESKALRVLVPLQTHLPLFRSNNIGE